MGDIRLLQERHEENLKRRVHVLNPTSEYFSVNYEGKKYTLVPGTQEEMPYYAAEKMVKRIVDWMTNKTDKIMSPARRKELEERVRLYEPSPIQ